MYIVCGDVWFVRTNHVVGEIVHIGLRSTQLTHVHGIGIVHAIAHVGNGITTVVQAVARQAHVFAWVSRVVDGNTIVVHFGIARRYAVHRQVFFQTHGYFAIRAHLGLNVAAVVIRKCACACAFNAQRFARFNGFVRCGYTRRFAVACNGEACASRISGIGYG